MLNHTSDHSWMRHALTLAENGRLTTSPNPMVGCVIVKQGVILAEAYHAKSGEPHAERLALNHCRCESTGATLYVTLEPCCHTGKTPPCVNAIIEANIKRVVIATTDPNPLMNGKSITLLRQAGIEVDVGICANDAAALNKRFFHFMKTGLPYVHAKWAMTLDGQTKTHPATARHITAKSTQESAHTLRAEVDAIMVGRNTITEDNPTLNARVVNGSPYLGKQPLRIILTSKGDIPLNSRIITDTSTQNTLIVVNEKFEYSSIKRFSHYTGVSILSIPEDKNNQIDILELLKRLGKRGVTSLLLEGGMTLIQSFIRENLINKVHVYISPTLQGTLKNPIQLNNHHQTTLHSDTYFLGEVSHV